MSAGEHHSAVDALIGQHDARGVESADAEGERAERQRVTSEGETAVDDREPEQWWESDAAAESEELADKVEADLDALRAERDAFLADSQRLAADFANYRKQTEKRVADAAAAQSAGLVRNLLPVLDACDSALEQDPDSGVGPIRQALLSELERSGLMLVAPEADQPFDPEQHEAVQHETSEDGESPDGPVVAELFRAGYAWKGRVIRPAMVKVTG